MIAPSELIINPDGSCFHLHLKPEQLADGYVMSVLVLVGVGTFLHSLIDYTVSIMLWKPVRAALPSLAELRE